jgi:hypothetical protein
MAASVVDCHQIRESHELPGKPMRPDSKKIGSLFSELHAFLSSTVAFPFVRDDVEVPTGAEKKLSVSASGDHRASS